MLSKEMINYTNEYWAMWYWPDTLSTHVKISSLPPHEGDIVVDIFVYIDSPELFVTRWFGSNIENNFVTFVSRVSTTYVQDTDATLTDASAPPPFEIKDYYTISASA